MSSDAAFFADLRHREFGRLDRANVAYLDYTGSALHADTQRRAYDRLLDDAILGNPHSLHHASTASTRAIEAARATVLAMLDGGDDYAVCFTANTSAAVRLVAEAYAFGPEAPLLLAADNHNSVNGMREYARRRGACVHYLPLDGELRLRDAPRFIETHGRRGGLLAFPAQSNFSGVRHPLALIDAAHGLQTRVLVDAAAYLSTSDMSLRTHPADFIALSFYKLFGLPTGVGALVARRDALAELDRPWFAGGTVDYASVQLERHELRPGEAAFEDGTPNFLGIAALASGFQFRERIGMDRAAAHVRRLTGQLIDGLLAMTHRNGTPVARLYGPATLCMRGGIVAFNVLSSDGVVVPFESVEARANERGVLLRGGCFCNPGAAEAAFAFEPLALSHALDALSGTFTIPNLRRRLGDTAVGAVRASLGVANSPGDVDRALSLVEEFRNAPLT